MVDLRGLIPGALEVSIGGAAGRQTISSLTVQAENDLTPCLIA
jgi:hypothetical protein